ncbi:MAG: hypothetical protein OXB84_00110, partial [Halobacteriovoraceae bacterium]|nr:hypothetical protein [Halobacteriovoraceae bacterium]
MYCRKKRNLILIFSHLKTIKLSSVFLLFAILTFQGCGKEERTNSPRSIPIKIKPCADLYSSIQEITTEKPSEVQKEIDLINCIMEKISSHVTWKTSDLRLDINPPIASKEFDISLPKEFNHIIPLREYEEMEEIPIHPNNLQFIMSLSYPKESSEHAPVKKGIAHRIFIFKNFIGVKSYDEKFRLDTDDTLSSYDSIPHSYRRHIDGDTQKEHIEEKDEKQIPPPYKIPAPYEHPSYEENIGVTPRKEETITEEKKQIQPPVYDPLKYYDFPTHEDKTQVTSQEEKTNMESEEQITHEEKNEIIIPKKQVHTVYGPFEFYGQPEYYDLPPYERKIETITHEVESETITLKEKMHPVYESLETHRPPEYHEISPYEENIKIVVPEEKADRESEKQIPLVTEDTDPQKRVGPYDK